MCYGEIREIVDVKTYDIMGTEIKKCEIVTKNGKNCMENLRLMNIIFCAVYVISEKNIQMQARSG